MRATVARWLAQRRPGTVLSLVLFGFGLPAYVFTVSELDLPDRHWVIFFSSSVILGFAVGRGWALLGAIAVIAALWSTGPGAGEGNAYTIWVFFPLAILSIAAGVLVHRLIARLIAVRLERSSGDKTLWDVLRSGQSLEGEANNASTE